MTFVPIVERELRVAARKRSTIWFRVSAALLAVFIGIGFLMMSQAVGASSLSLGRGLFATLTWLVFVATVAAGLFFTADAISEEKREGTLGFLFLTDLRGYDIIGGKLAATSLRGSYALLAVFPVLGVTLLMGGVTGAQFWKCSLSLVNALFCSLAAGLLASSLCRDAQRAMTATFLLLLLFCAGGPCVDSVLAGVHRASFEPSFSLTSPVYVFLRAASWGKTSFWPALAVSHGMAWLALAVASFLVPRTWHDKPKTASQERWYARRYLGPQARTPRRLNLLSRNPVQWLVTRERWQSAGAWFITAMVFCGFLLVSTILPRGIGAIWTQVSRLATLVMYLWITSNSCRFFVDAKRKGMMELLLVTPLTGKDIVLGQRHALFRLFGPPVMVLLLVELASASLSSSPVFAGTGTGRFLPWLTQVFMALSAVVSTLANMVALMWFGMWTGLTSRNAGLASLRTLVFVQVFPWLGIVFASTTLAGILVFSGFALFNTPNRTAFLFPFIMFGVSAVLTVAKDIAFILWARRSLFSRFRIEAARSVDSRAFPQSRQVIAR